MICQSSLRRAASFAFLAALSAATLNAHAPSIALSKKYLNFAVAPGRPSPPPQAVILSDSTHGWMPWTATASTSKGGNWLTVTPASGELVGVNPSLEWAYLTVSVVSTPLPAGVYYGTITVAAPGNATTPPADNTPQVIQVALTIGTDGAAAPGIGLSPTSLTVDGTAGSTRGVSVPVQITNTGGGVLNWTAVPTTATGGNWLSVAPAAGVNSGVISATAGLAALGAGTYTGQITIAAAGAANSPQLIPVTFRVRAPAAPVLQLSPATIVFSIESAGPGLQPEALQIYNGGEGSLNWRADVSTFNGGLWLAIAPNSGAGPGTVAVSALPGSLPAGTYAGRITVNAEGAANSPAEVPVTLTVRAPRPVFDERGVVNAATFLTGFLAPGQIATIFGERLGPPDKAVFTLDPVTQKIPTSLAGTEVTFDGIAAPLFFVSDRQVNLQVPFELAGKSYTRILVGVRGLEPAEALLPLREAAPGVFTLDGARAAALNQDSTLNSPENPATPGSIVQMFLTGQGVLDPILETGSLAPTSPPFPAPVLPVSVTMAGVNARVLFAGAAPGFAGLTQLNVEVPRDLVPSSQVNVSVLVGPNPAGKRVTISVR